MWYKNLFSAISKRTCVEKSPSFSPAMTSQINKSTLELKKKLTEIGHVLYPKKEHLIGIKKMTKIIKKDRYHSWMQNVELQELTASEPLTLEEEYAMQLSWLEDEKKCTFIVLDKYEFEKSKDEIEAMIGDVNLFFNDQDNLKKAEVEVMIAETKKRHQGKGKEALLFMLRYGVESLEVNNFMAKIKMNNSVSLKLFESIGFIKVNESRKFQEITLECPVSEIWKNQLFEETKSYTIKNDEFECIS